MHFTVDILNDLPQRIKQYASELRNQIYAYYEIGEDSFTNAYLELKDKIGLSRYTSGGLFFLLLCFTMELYADIILPVPLQQLFTYGIPAELVSSVTAGVRVYVPFGRGRHLTGIVASVHKNKPTEYQTKDIISVLDGETPMVLPYQLKLIEWI